MSLSHLPTCWSEYRCLSHIYPPVGVSTDEDLGVWELTGQHHGGLSNGLRLPRAKWSVDDQRGRVARPLSHNVLHDLELVLIQHTRAVRGDNQQTL